MKILFVVHRIYPYNGGSEYNVKLISEGLVNKNYEVTILSDDHLGDFNNIKVTNDRNELFSDKYSWVIIHGNDMPLQDYALFNIKKIKSKVMYWIIKPSYSLSGIQGLINSTIIGWGTSYDYEYIKKHNFEYKSRYIRYSINISDNLGIKTNDKKNDKIYISSGGFSEHKGFNELIKIFNELNLTNTKLILTGYINQPPIVSNPNIIIKEVINRKEYLNILTNSDLYIMNSYSEGFGLVLLDAMINKIPWISRDIAGATDMKNYGTTYNSYDELKKLMTDHTSTQEKINNAYEYVLKDRNLDSMVSDFISVFSQKDFINIPI